MWCFYHVCFACTCSTSQLPKVLPDCQFFTFLQHHSRVHFFNLSTTKSAPELMWIYHFDFQMCFPPSRLHFFNLSTLNYQSYQKVSGAEVFLPFWFRLPNVLRDFSTFLRTLILILSSDSFSSDFFSLRILSLLWLLSSLLLHLFISRKFDF